MSKSALAITEEHKDLAEAAIGQLDRLNSRAAARATLEGGPPIRPTSGRRPLNSGGSGLAIAEEHGGSGFGLAELAVVLEAQGRELCPGPFLPSVAAAVVIDRCATDSLRAQLLPGLADGTTVGALGVSGNVTVGSDLVVTGESPAVLGAPDADVLVIAAGEDVVVVDADADGVTVTAAGVAGHHPQRRVGRTARRGGRRGPGAARRRAQGADGVPDPGVGRGGRRQLGDAWRWPSNTPRCASSSAGPSAPSRRSSTTPPTCSSNAEETTAATWDAARADDLDSAWFAAAVAASHAIRTQIFNAQNNIQLHGGIGFTWEHDAHLYLRRARTLAALMADGADPLLDVVEASAQRPGARRVVHAAAGSRGVPRPGARGRHRSCARCRADKQRDFLVDSGYLVPHWPKPWGRAADVLEQLVIEEEFGDVERPDMGITGWVTLTIAQAGTDDQRERWVEPVLRGQVMWCQLFSEPGAGSRRRRGAYGGQEGRRRVAGHRPEGVDQPGPHVPVGTGDRAHRSRRPQARRRDDDGDRHESPWRDGQSAARGSPGTPISTRCSSTTSSFRTRMWLAT